MIIHLKTKITDPQRKNLERRLARLGVPVYVSPGSKEDRKSVV